jgi:hypothetical protein
MRSVSDVYRGRSGRHPEYGAAQTDASTLPTPGHLELPARDSSCKSGREASRAYIAAEAAVILNTEPQQTAAGLVLLQGGSLLRVQGQHAYGAQASSPIPL